jgi:type IX secretion system PorP/SprF family membrane protein
MRRMRNYILVLLSFFVVSVNAQDHIYSQFYNAPLYLNPALTGQFEGDIRMNMIYRNQWSGLSGDLSYLSASVDLNIPHFGGGVGLQFTRSSEGIAYLRKNNIAGTYSYSVGDDDFVTSFGIQAGFTNRRIDLDKLVFSDQIDANTGFIPGSSTSAQILDISNRFYFDAGTGVNMVFKNFMAGASLYHINKPDESFTEVQAKLPTRIVGYASMKISLLAQYNYYEDDGMYMIPSVVYYRQGASQAISMGAQFKYRTVNMGLWYRTSAQNNPDAMVVSFIFDIFKNNKNGEKLRLGISHDATASKINYTNTSGSTEASVGYEKYFPGSSGYNKFNGLRCYDFY